MIHQGTLERKAVKSKLQNRIAVHGHRSYNAGSCRVSLLLLLLLLLLVAPNRRQRALQPAEDMVGCTSRGQGAQV
jgi:hypothetical protein